MRKFVMSNLCNIFLLWFCIAITPTKAAQVTTSFTPNAITSGQTSVFKIMISNITGATLTGGNLTNNLPYIGPVGNPTSRIIVASPVTITNNTCGDGTTTGVITTTTTTITITNASIAVGNPVGCSFDVLVLGQSSTTGTVSITNDIPPGALTFTPPNPDQNNTLASDTSLSITAISQPTVTLTLGKSTVFVDESTNLAVRVNNTSGAIALTNLAWPITLPTNIVMAGTATLTNCGSSASYTAPIGGNSIQLSGATIAASGNCTMVIPIKGTATGSGYPLTMVAGAIIDDQLASNASDVSTTLNVQTISINKRFLKSDGATVTSSEIVGLPFKLELTVANSANTTYTNLTIIDPTFRTCRVIY